MLIVYITIITPQAMLNYVNLLEFESAMPDFTAATCHSVIGQPIHVWESRQQ